MNRDDNTFAEVVEHVEGEDSWQKTPETNKLSRFHLKFWGESMEKEAKHWHDAHPFIEDDHGLVGDSDEDEPMTEPMDFEDNDFIKGCYVMDLDVRGFPVSKLWVRAEYIRIYNYVEDYYNRMMCHDGRPPSVVLTGQPGIGKSLWIYYALRRRLAERRSVIWYHLGQCYLFVEEGVFSMPQRFLISSFHTAVWTLVDSDENRDGVPPHLVAHGTRLFVIYATSPAKDRWSRLPKTTRSVTVVMNPWTRNEIFQAAQIKPANFRPEFMDEIFDKYGPIPRLCIEYMDEPDLLEDYLEQLYASINNIGIAQLQMLFVDAKSLDMDSISHKISLIARKEREKINRKIIVAPITPFIKAKLAIQLRNVKKEEQLNLYEYFARVPESRQVSGVFFEARIQGRLQEGISLELVPMVKLDASGSGSLPRWYSSHVPLVNTTLEARRQQALQQTLVVKINPTAICEYTEGGPDVVEPNVLYIPAISNQVSLDSFILVDGALYIFQITIASKHDVKKGLVSFLRRMVNLPPFGEWRFIFAIAPNMTLITPQSSSPVLLGLVPYSAVIDPRC